MDVRQGRLSITGASGGKLDANVYVKSDPPSLSDAAVVIPAASAVVAGLALVFAAIQAWMARDQYARDLQWRRSSLIGDELRRMIATEEIDLVCRMLDWRGGWGCVPARYAYLLGSREIRMNWTDFVASVAVERPPDWMSNRKRYLYRSCFDDFCNALNLIYSDPRLSDLKTEPDRYSSRFRARSRKQTKAGEKKPSDDLSDARFGEHLVSIALYCKLVIDPLKPDCDLKKRDGAIDETARSNMKAFIEKFYSPGLYEFIGKVAELHRGTPDATTDTGNHLPLNPARSRIWRARRELDAT
ncbi:MULTISPECIES: hypothetical protein [Sphingomonas]|uniref:hypothetical protein n=1 Tax=Sphingomonas TaxID=13687 RepID=UPI001143AEA0|nr:MULTISPECIES: hypothetical protein [Sphingomonas]